MQQYQGGNFITGPAIADLENVATGGHNTGRRMVGIRGYGYPSGDDFQSRPVMGQSEGLNEALTSSKVPATDLYHGEHFALTYRRITSYNNHLLFLA